MLRVPWAMRILLLALHALLFSLCLPLFAVADNDHHLARLIHGGNVHRIDRYMANVIERAGRDLRAPSYLHPLGGAEDHIMALYETLRRQIGVTQVDWDRCVIKADTWPGTWTLGVVFRTREGHVDDILERCYTIQGGVPGTVNLFGWRPRVRKDRQELKCIKAKACAGFLEEQRARCAARKSS